MTLTGCVFAGIISTGSFKWSIFFKREDVSGCRIRMQQTGKRVVLGRNKGYLSVAGPQYRFIIFLLIVLGIFTLLLKVFQKLAEFVDFPVFLPIALVTLLVFIGIIGAAYSHTIVGPLLRIRRTLQQLAEGEMSMNLRLRETDDPMLKEIAREISALCEHSRNSSAVLRESLRDLFKDVVVLQEMIRLDAPKSDIEKHLNELHKRQDEMEKMIKSLCKV